MRRARFCISDALPNSADDAAPTALVTYVRQCVGIASRITAVSGKQCPLLTTDWQECCLNDWLFQLVDRWVLIHEQKTAVFS